MYSTFSCYDNMAKLRIATLWRRIKILGSLNKQKKNTKSFSTEARTLASIINCKKAASSKHSFVYSIHRRSQSLSKMYKARSTPSRNEQKVIEKDCLVQNVMEEKIR